MKLFHSRYLNQSFKQNSKFIWKLMVVKKTVHVSTASYNSFLLFGPFSFVWLHSTLFPNFNKYLHQPKLQKIAINVFIKTQPNLLKFEFNHKQTNQNFIPFFLFTDIRIWISFLGKQREIYTREIRKFKKTIYNIYSEKTTEIRKGSIASYLQYKEKKNNQT